MVRKSESKSLDFRVEKDVAQYLSLQLEMVDLQLTVVLLMVL